MDIVAQEKKNNKRYLPHKMPCDRIMGSGIIWMEFGQR